MIYKERLKPVGVNSEPGINFFREQLSSAEQLYMKSKNKQILDHLHREHSVLGRTRHTYIFKGNVFVPAAIILQGLKSVITFHTAYLVGNEVTITGTPGAVDRMNKVYKRGLYSKTDWEVLNNLITYGNAYEYVYLDSNGNIRSKVFKNSDSFPIYDCNSEYKYFVEYWKDKQGDDEHYNIYYPSHVDTYINGRLIDSKENYTGLPIHYVAMERAEYDVFGDSMLLDLIPIQDRIEALLSKLDDAITTLSLNPVGVITGARMSETDMVNSNVAGAVLNLDEGNDFKYANAEMDYNCIKYELDQLYQQFNLVAAIPSSILGQSNIANVSQDSLSMIYQLTENRGKQNINSLIEGFYKRWEKMRILMNLNGNPMTDEDYDSLGASFNISKPTDTAMNMENMEIQYNMGAISKRTIIELSPYTTNSAQEMQRLEDEGKPIDEKADIENAETDIESP